MIPVFNRENFISECIQSALDQTYDDFEVIVVDNKSEDCTFEICQGFAVRDPRVKVFQNDMNIGPVRNWQACVEKASGEFSKILFSDDALIETCLEKLVPRLESPDVAFVFCAAHIGETLENSNVAYDLGGDKEISADRFTTLALRAKVPWSPGAVFLRTEDLKRNLRADFPTATPQPFDRHGAGPDVMIMLLTALNYSRIAYLRDPEVFFRAHHDSFTVNNAGGLVQDGYQAAFCYFLRQNVSYFDWMKYVSLIWLETLIQKKTALGLRSFLVKREGTGRVSECALVISIAIYAALEFLLVRTVAKSHRLFRKIAG